jgi:hypothetical protein
MAQPEQQGPAVAPLVATFLLELPVDLNLPDGATVSAYERRRADDIDFFGTTPNPGLRIDSRFVFRRTRAADAGTRPVAFAVFDDFWEGLRFVDSRPTLEHLDEPRPKTVVAASTGRLVESVDGRARATEEELTQMFERALEQLNEFLTMLGFVTSHPDVGAVRRTELPTHIPVVLDLDPLGQLPRHAELATMQLHGFTSDPVSDDLVVYATDLAFRDRADRWPPKPIVGLLHRAYRDRYAGAHDQAVISLGTAIEIMVEIAVGEALRVTGASQERVGRVLQAGFQNLLRDHLAPMLQRLDCDTNVIERWLADCYTLRNQVAHEGYVPSHREVIDASDATWRLAGEIAEALRTDPALAPLGAAFPVGRHERTDGNGRIT